MKLLLDEMHGAAVAVALWSRGHDVLAVSERVDLRGLSDEELLAAAAGEARSVVTQNVRDFAVLHGRWANRDLPHAGIIFTHPRRFPRASARYVSRLVAALDAFLGQADELLGPGNSYLWWLG